MKELPYRQVHLDFHTSEVIKNIGKNFSKEQFQQMLIIGHVNSITVFSKCHHGWAYHPSKANEMHPNLDFDLLGAMIEAAHEIGVKTPVYLSAGFDEKLARLHPEWLIRDKEEKLRGSDFMRPGYHLLCFNTPYLDILLSQIYETLKNYDADGLFLDIVGVRECYCQNCIRTIRSIGKDPRDIESMKEMWENTYANYAKRVKETVDGIKPGLNIFHNSGHIQRGRRDHAFFNTHLELESLPTGGWGYDHFPMSVRYVQNLGMNYLGMTGKFHTTWGEFGGYKHPNALKYEVALCIANGARCSIGDQLHPDGLLDEATYRLIGKAYAEVESKEEWCRDAINIADVAVLSAEAWNTENKVFGGRNSAISDKGMIRILLEGKFLFDVIDTHENFNKYKVIILPDIIRVNSSLKQKLQEFLDNGGRILATGESGLNEEGNGFELDFGVKWLGVNPYKPDYFRPHFDLKNLDNAAFVFYSQGQKVELTDGGVELGHREDPYFNRDIFTFCSHQHTPSSKSNSGPGMVESKSGIYIAWKVFEDYAIKGSLVLKETVIYALNRLLSSSKTFETDLPAQGIVTLTHQVEKNRYVSHMLYASPVLRGEGTQVIEDIIPIYNVEAGLRIPKKAKKVYLAPSGTQINFEYSDDGLLKYKVPDINCHQMVVIDY